MSIKLIKKVKARILGRSVPAYKHLGYKTKIANTARVTVPDNLVVGDYSYIGGDCFLSTEGGIEIGKGTSIAFSTVILSSNHNWNSTRMIPYDEYSITKKVIIGDYCWIGCHSKIAPGVNIGEGAIVAMGSVVTQNVPRGAIVGGNPARIIKYRDLDTFDALKNAGMSYHKIKSEEPDFQNIFVTQLPTENEEK